MVLLIDDTGVAGSEERNARRPTISDAVNWQTATKRALTAGAGARWCNSHEAMATPYHKTASICWGCYVKDYRLAERQRQDQVRAAYATALQAGAA